MLLYNKYYSMNNMSDFTENELWYIQSLIANDLRLKQHIYDTRHNEVLKTRIELRTRLLEKFNLHQCAICFNEYRNIDTNENHSVYNNCSHSFCTDCLVKLTTISNYTCAICRGDTTHMVCFYSTRNTNPEFYEEIEGVEIDIPAEILTPYTEEEFNAVFTQTYEGEQMRPNEIARLTPDQREWTVTHYRGMVLGNNLFDDNDSEVDVELMSIE